MIATTLLIYFVDKGARFQFYFVILLSLIILMSIALILNLSEKYKASLLITILCISITPWISILLDNTVANGDFAPLYFIVLSISFSAIFLSEWPIIIVALVQLTSLIIFIQSSPMLLKDNWPSFISFVVISSVVGIVISSVNRKQLILIKDQKKVLSNNELKLHELSIRDALTGLYNRRFMEEILEKELEKNISNNQSFGIIIMDVDKFKIVNDTYGHIIGDSVLVQIAKILQKNSRESDYACRFGGDEVIMILPDCTLEKTYQKAENLRTIINEVLVKVNEVDFIHISLSFGVASLPENGKNIDSVLKAADNALYESKNSGGNQVVVSKKTFDLSIKLD